MKNENEIISSLGRIEALLAEQEEQYLTFEQGANFLGLSSSYTYKLTSTNQLPFYRPSGKRIYFKRSELQKWISSHRVASIDELEMVAVNRLQSSRQRA